MNSGHTIDLIIVTVYLTSIAVLGIFTASKQKSIKDYFLGADKVHWLAVSFSIIAAETSALTFISIPGLAYKTNFQFLQLTFGFLIGRIAVAVILLPRYYQGEISTAYTFLENRFGKKIRTFASIVFLVTRVASDGVRLFAAAIPLYLLLDISPVYAILIISVIALIYTYTGGLKSIIYVDAFQMIIYLGGAIVILIFIINHIDLNIFSNTELLNQKFATVNLGYENSLGDFFKQPYTLLSGLIGGAFLSMASHGTDQLIVQRLLALQNLKKSQVAIITSGVIIVFQFAIFLFIGFLLFSFYGVTEMKSDEVLPTFIINQLPKGLSGFIIAGVFAAALSTLAGSISSLSSSTMIDLFLNNKKDILDEKVKLRYSRIFTIIWTIILAGSAFFFMNTDKAVVELALSISSFTFGGMLGTFLLGIFNKKVNEKIALISFVLGIIVVSVFIIFKLVAWTWFVFIGVATVIINGNILTIVNRK
ncbi:MAG: sodium:solute symporter [Ignavibacterium sp.]|nr:sodium:solute symporter [Ignavibacterium sp.]MDW8375104.1 sodium:solute symporter [Ignavibacteriales bacterium]